MLLSTLSILTLSIPTLYELWKDRNGDHHPNHDWILRGVLMVVCAGIVSMVNVEKNFIQAFIMSFGIFMFFFPYLVNIVQSHLTKDYKWWDHLSATAWPDKLDAWRGLHWSIRMLMMAIVFSACVKLYLCWGKFLSFYNAC